MRYSITAVLLVCLLATAQADTRTWTSSTGKFSIEAELVEVTDGKVELRRADGRSVTVPLDKLCEADRDYVAQQAGDSASKPPSEESSSAEATPSGEEMRTWTSRGGGHKMEARFVTFKDGKAELLKADGQTLRVSLSKLSADDGRYVRGILAERRKAGSSSGSSGTRPTRGPGVELGDEPLTIELEPLLVEMPRSGARGPNDAMAQYLMRMVSPQTFYQRSAKGTTSSSASAAAFKQAVSKEPEFESEAPFRGVAKLGSQQFGFALDAVDAKTPGFGRLFFDVNGNGDLSDDKPINGVLAGAKPTETHSSYQFPRVELKFDVDGQEVEYAFAMSVYSRKTASYSYTSASLMAAACREGTLGKGRGRTQIVLLDSNSNGRYDDLCTVNESSSSGRVSTRYGDTLLVNPGSGGARSTGGVDDGRLYLSKMLSVGKGFYDVEVTPAGDKLTLSPSEAPIGQVTNPSPTYSAMIFSAEHGVVRIAGSGKQRVPLPVGEWRLATCKIDATPGGAAARGGRTYLAAAATKETNPFTVTEDETVPLPFGAPLRPVVTSSGRASGGKIYLSLNIVGTGGERCTSLTVGGSRPPAPEFQIVAPDGKVVEQGKFAYG